MVICKYIEAHSVSQPDAIAVRFNQTQSTYVQLYEQTNQLARYLNSLGISNEDRVVVCLEPSLEIAASLLAILKVGAVYVPLDPSYPSEHLVNILAEIQPKVVVTQAHLQPRLPATPKHIFCIDKDWETIQNLPAQNLEHDISLQQTAYIIYTSGTTEKPNGVMVSHRNLLHSILAAQEKYGFNAQDVMPAIANFTFSISLLELLCPLVAGGTLLILERDRILDFERMVQVLQQITVIHAEPSLLSGLLAYIEDKQIDPQQLKALRHISTGEDILPIDILERMKKVFQYAEMADYVNWLQERLNEEFLDQQLAYWQKQLAYAPPLLDFPLDRPRPATQTYRGETEFFTLDAGLTSQIKIVTQRTGITLFIFLMSAFAILLSRYSRQQDLVIGTPIANRNRQEFESLINCFINLLALRIDLTGNPTFIEVIEQAQQIYVSAYAHQDIPFGKLVEKLCPSRSFSYSPIFQVMFVLQNALVELSPPVDFDLKPLNVETGTSQYDLTLMVEETEVGLSCTFEYNSDLLNRATIKRLVSHFETLLESIVDNPKQSIAELAILTDKEQQLLIEWNNTSADYPQDKCIHQLFENQVERTPDAIAVVVSNDEQLTYRELNSRANQLSHYLQSQGVVTETLVAVCIARSVQMLVAILGILKAGATYIPLDPSYPHERRISKLRNARVPLALTVSDLSSTLADCGAKVVSLDLEMEAIAQHSKDNLFSPVTAENLAYVIYTSGSTGEPKGVTISHRSMVNHSLAVSEVYELNTQDRVLHFSNISFDVAVEEIFPTFLSGGTLVLAPTEVYTSVTYFLDLLNQQALTVINLPTAFWSEMVYGMSILKQSLPESLRLVIVGGEKVSKSTYNKWRSLVGTFPRWLNAYGPTEATVTATIYDPLQSTEALHPDAEVPIGRAIANLQTYVLDLNLKPSPIGAAGELYIGGVGLSRGYLNRPDITAKRFIPNPFSKNSEDCLYKTGDVARYLPDGNIEFIGRSDFQIKIRGFRVEPIEIETQLEKYPAIKQAIVLCHDALNGEKFLVAYLSAEQDQIIDIDVLGEFLRQKIPAYMLPSSFIVLDVLPLTPNGKVDRRALIELDIAKKQAKEVIAPRDELEQQLAFIWQKLFGIQDISIHANFFELGGNSLLAVRLVAEIEKIFNYHFPLSSFFQMGTIAEIARWMREKPSETISLNDIPIGLNLEDHRAFLSLCAGRIGKHIGKQGLIVEVSPIEMKSSKPFIWIGYTDFSKNLGLHQPVYTIPGGSWTPLHSTENYIEAIASIIVDELLSVPQDGSYLIGGNCYEGVVAMEVAHQLQRKGKEVSFLGLIDSPGPSKTYYILRQIDFKLCLLKFHLLQLFPLSLIDKGKYILERMFSFNAEEEIRKTESEREYSQSLTEQSPQKPKSPLNEYDRILPQAWDSIDKVLQSHRSKRYSGKVLLTSPTKSGMKSRRTEIIWTDLSWLFPRYGWEKLLTGEVELYPINCAHADVGMKKNAEQIGRLIWKDSEEFR
jgi:amino acid adenylation domain-containing protein